jgi:PPOX class probable F420-dependent enzyme
VGHSLCVADTVRFIKFQALGTIHGVDGIAHGAYRKTAVESLGAVQFVALTTFRATGVPVTTTVWTVTDGDSLVVTTARDSGKVKRLRCDPRIELRPSGRRRVRTDDRYVVTGIARIVDDDDELRRCHGVLSGKYGWQFRLAMAVERATGGRDRVLLRITIA